ncbi:unnamed protein product [Mytilus edulis]|uniref:WSC domain-containing protein n=1 Tax=Mytilus edulis TaxID=6550 RepID=A0A8S3SCR6_MYTED|nr:unnamed protein product [Mytilus edulis]
MMFIIHLLELFLFSVVYKGSVVATSKGLMNFNDCKRSTPINSNKPNVRDVLDDDLFLQMPLMSHKGCFYDKGSWDATAIYTIDWDITSSCSCKCWKNEFFALRGNRCACLNSLLNMMKTDLNYCNYTCAGSKKDPCGAARVFTVYEHTVRKITTDTNVQTSMPFTLQKFTSNISTPVYPITKPSFHVKMINNTVISVGLLLVVTGIVVIVILIFRKW